MDKVIKTKKAKKGKTAKTAAVDLSLRDQFAARAMSALIAAAPTMDPELIACDAYSFADGMMAVRSRNADRDH